MNNYNKNNMYALFDILTGVYKERDFCSIRYHLSKLLNARRGSLVHLPDYGIPDVTEVMQGLPYSIDGFITEVRQTIEKYEPRLRNVVIKSVANNRNGAILHLQILANSFDNKSRQFDSYFSDGTVRIVD